MASVPRNDLTGRKFQTVTVLADAGMKRRCRLWLCWCECGEVREIRQEKLLRDVGRMCDAPTHPRPRCSACGCVLEGPRKLKHPAPHLCVTFSDADADLRLFRWSRAGDGYAHTCMAKHLHPSGFAHRIVTSRMIGYVAPSEEVTDHLNRVITDNRRENLRCVSQAVNMSNVPARKGSRSGFRGASAERGGKKWRAQVIFRGVTYYLGTFLTASEAGEAARVQRLALGLVD